MTEKLRYRAVIGAAALAVGLLQAWDSNALQAGAVAQVLVAVGVALPAAAIVLSTEPGPRLLALIAGALLLTWARVIAPVPMNALHLAIFAPALFVLASRALGPEPTSCDAARTPRPGDPSR